MELYHAPLCGMSGGRAMQRLEMHATRAPSSSTRWLLLAWKMLGWALTVRRKTGEPLQPPADLPPFAHLSRRSDWKTATSGDVQTYTPPEFFLNDWMVVRSVIDDFDIVTEPALAVSWMHDALQTIAVNVLGLQSTDRYALSNVASALSGGGTLFNHACAPTHNCAYRSNAALEDGGGSTIYFVTTKPVAPGDELTVSYFEEGTPFERRQTRLFSQYGFVCKCALCKADMAVKAASTAAAAPASSGDAAASSRAAAGASGTASDAVAAGTPALVVAAATSGPAAGTGAAGTETAEAGSAAPATL